MFTKPKTWISGGIWKPKNPHSLEHLKYLYSVLCKNQTVTDTNRSLLVETLRSISEILIWGDQNDGSVFDFFLEKNMLAFFLRYLRQKSGRFICVQLLQTLNILFENISNETSVYYLLSNNHINSIIVHKFDFSDEEVMAYYISFLKTLSLKLNKHTIHFFYNEHTNDFALYTEAIKFFNHSESMVRIAVRTITLNVYKVDDKSMLRYIRNKTATPYFSNLVWFIGNHILELDACVHNDVDHQSRDRLADLVAEHLDHLHYLNDILCLKIDCLNDVLTDHLLNRLFIPLYVYSLTKTKKFRTPDEPPFVSHVVSLFLLAEVFLIVSHPPLVRKLADIVFNGDHSIFCDDAGEPGAIGSRMPQPGFIAPDHSLAQSLELSHGSKSRRGSHRMSIGEERQVGKCTFYTASASDTSNIDDSLPDRVPTPPPSTDSEDSHSAAISDSAPLSEPHDDQGLPPPVTSPTVDDLSVMSWMSDVSKDHVMTPGQNSTDEEKLLGAALTPEQIQAEFTLTNRPYLESIFKSLECQENDYEALYGLCLLYALSQNTGFNSAVLETIFMSPGKSQSQSKDRYNIFLVETLIKVITSSCQNSSKIRLATLEMSTILLKHLVMGSNGMHYLQDRHLACIEGAKEESILLLRNFYKSEEIFLDMFEDDFRDLQKKPLNVEYLMMDASILLPPTVTPLTGIDFIKRLPCGEVERARRAIRVFFSLRQLSLSLKNETDSDLPLTKPDDCVKVGDVLDLNNSDLIACTVITRDRRERRFLVIDSQQLILVEPDIKRLGWGVVRFVGFLQDTEVSGDKEDSRSLHVTIHRPAASNHARPIPLLAAKFAFDDHIRCMAAKQRLTKGRHRARQRKMHSIARLLELPSHVTDSMYPQYTSQYSGGAATVVQSRGQSHGHSHAIPPTRPSTTSQQHPQQHHSAVPAPIAPTRRHKARPQHVTIRSSSKRNSEPEIEQAQDVTSPSATAFQTLNASATTSTSTADMRTSSKSAKVPTNMPMEIPMEDLSIPTDRQRRQSGPLLDTTPRRRTTPPGGRTGDVKKRSSSYSPHRKSQPKSTSFTSSPSPQVMKAAVQRLEKRTKTLLQQRPRSMSGPTDAAHRMRNAVEEASANTTAELTKIGQQLLSMSKAPPPKSLTPASGPSVSLYQEPISGRMSAPTLLPPTDFPYSMRQTSAPDVSLTADLGALTMRIDQKRIKYEEEEPVDEIEGEATASSPPKQVIPDRRDEEPEENENTL